MSGASSERDLNLTQAKKAIEKEWNVHAVRVTTLSSFRVSVSTVRRAVP